MTESTKTARLNRAMLGKLVVMAVLMFGFGYALIPVYKQVCELLGVNSLDQKDERGRNTQVDMSRSVTVELTSSELAPFRFRPVQASVTVHPGELKTITYEVVNTLGRTVVAQAVPSYAPQNAGRHFKKVECFCFTQQTLKPHEAKQYPVVFFIDPALPKDVKTITLSYTFFEVAGATAQR